MILSTNQIVALRFLRDHGGRDSSKKAPWQMDGTQYRRVLDALVRKGMARQLESGCVSMVLGGGAQRMADSRRFTPDHQITEEGLRALEGALR